MAGRPKRIDDRVSVGISLPQTTRDELNQIAGTLQVSMADIVRVGLDMALDLPATEIMERLEA